MKNGSGFVGVGVSAKMAETALAQYSDEFAKLGGSPGGEGEDTLLGFRDGFRAALIILQEAGVIVCADPVAR